MYLIKVRLQSINFNLISSYSSFIFFLLQKYNIKLKRINLPKKTDRIVLLRSPHVHKKSKQVFIRSLNKTLLSFSCSNKVLLKHIYSQIILRKPKSLSMTWNFFLTNKN